MGGAYSNDLSVCLSVCPIHWVAGWYVHIKLPSAGGGHISWPCYTLFETVYMIFVHYGMQETDDSEPQLEDAAEPAQAASQPADPLIPERDVPVTTSLLLSHSHIAWHLAKPLPHSWLH